MATNPNYAKYHPRWYRRRIPIFWWLTKWSSAKFIMRELTSVFVATYAVILLFQMRSVSAGPDVYRDFLRWASNPFAIVLHVILLVCVLCHTITWFNLAPKAMVIQLGKRKVPGILIAAGNYVAWIVISALLIGLAWEGWPL